MGTKDGSLAPGCQSLRAFQGSCSLPLSKKAESWLLQRPRVVRSLQLGLCHPVHSGFKGPLTGVWRELRMGHCLNKGH